VRNAAGGEDHALLADHVLLTVDVHAHLAVEHVDRLVEVGMAVKRRRLAANDAVLDQGEGATGLL